MNSAASWEDGNNPVPHYGFYSFAPDGSTGFTAVSPTGSDYSWALSTNGGGGGIYDDGYFYCYAVYGVYYSYTVQFTKLDSHTWQQVASSSTSGNRTTDILVPDDLTSNPIDGKIYAVCRPKFGNSDYSVLATVNREDGTLTDIAHTRYFLTISCDAAGQLYGIGSDAVLYKLATDGSVEAVGSTGLAFFPMEQTATIDFRSGKMYLSHYGYVLENGKINYNSSVRGLYSIDTSTGKATLEHVYGDYQHLSALSIMNCHPSAPDNITDLKFEPKTPGSLTAVATFTVPKLTYNQQPLSGPVTATFYIDNAEAGSISTSAGQSVTHEFTNINLTEGNHTLAVVLNANNHDGVQAFASSFFGIDTPDHVNNLTLTASDDVMKATVSWEPPTGTLNGGSYDPEDVRYTVVRFPGNVTVYRSLKETSFTEDIDYEYALTSYVVTPYIDGTSKRGNSVQSNKVFLGGPWQMPYAEPFNSSEAFDSFTVIDANGDGGDWGWEDPVWKFDNVYYCAFFYDGNNYAADDWLITPKLDLDDSKLYRLTFQLYGYYEGRYHSLEISTGSSATAEDMHKKIYSSYATSTMTTPLTESCIFAPSAGDAYIGFHNITEEAQHMSIDNILVEEIGLSSVPAAVTDLKAEIISRSDGKVRLSFVTPSVDASGKALQGKLSVNIYRGDEKKPFKTLTDLDGGKDVTFEDHEAAQAVNIYRVEPTNASGTGLETSVSIDLRAGMPQRVKNVTARLLSDSQAVITWDAPDAAYDENGNAIDTKNLRYIVYRPLGDNKFETIANNLNECSFIDNEPTKVYSDQQGAVQYYVASVNADGESYATPSNVIYVGEAYSLPFSESWYQQTTQSAPWLTSGNGTASWVLAYKGYSPMTDGQDGAGLLSLEVSSTADEGQSSYWSPRFDLSAVKEAKLTFWIYGENTYKDNDWISVIVDIEGKNQVPTGSTFYPKNWLGWHECTVDLTPYVGNERVSIILLGNIVAQGSERRIHVDNLNITGTPVESEVKISSFSGPGSMRESVSGTFSATVANTGIHDAENIPVNFYADNELISTSTISYLSAGESTQMNFDYTPAEGSDEIVEIAVEIVPATTDDTVVTNNERALTVAVQPLNIPYVTDLSGEYLPDDNRINLFWSNPSHSEYVENVTDGAESYNAFAIEGVGAWTMYDGDGALPFKRQDPSTGAILVWDNNDVQQAWMVFRPGDVVSDNTFSPFSGDQMFTSWSCFGKRNDDWLISPELPGNGQLISFVVRRLNNAENKELYNVLYSTTDTDPASFHRLNGDTPLVAPAEWTYMYFALPEDAKHFAIQYTGYQQGALLIDNIMYEGYSTHLRLDGFNIYRDGTKLNSMPVTRLNYADNDAPFEKTSNYTVVPVYAGIEGTPSNIFSINPAGIATPGAGALVSVTGSKGSIRIMGAAGLEAMVYGIDGKLLMHRSITAPSESLSFAPGIYAVKIAGATHKVIVR